MKKVRSADGSAVPAEPAQGSDAALESIGASDIPSPEQVSQALKLDDGSVEKRDKGKKRAHPEAEDGQSSANGATSKKRIRKLAPPRPFPTVPTSMSATGPRSAHTEGKNYICITRKTPLGAYLRRCKDLILKDGCVLTGYFIITVQLIICPFKSFKSLHLSAMGAAIPHLVTLSTSLPSILPHSPDEIHTEIQTGTVEVQDEVVPDDDEDEDISYRTRGKSTLMIVIKIGDGVDEVIRVTGRGKNKGKFVPPSGAQLKSGKGKQKAGPSETAGREQVVVRAEDIEDMEE